MKNQKIKIYLFLLGFFLLFFFIFFPAKINFFNDRQTENLEVNPHSTSISQSNLYIVQKNGAKALLRDALDPQKSPNGGTITGWRFIRNLVNAGIVIILLLAAFSNILHINIDTYTIKKTLPALVLGVILANFSLLICRMFVDIGDVLTVTFLQEDISSPAAAGKFTDQIGAALGFTSGNVAGGHEAILGGILAGIVVIAATGWGIFLMLFLVLFMLLAPAFILLLLSLLIYARQGIVQLLVIFSPAAFFAMALPFTQHWFKMWWKQFLNWVFALPVIFLLLKLAMIIGSATGENTLLQWFMAVFMIVLSIMVPFKMGGIVGGLINKTGKAVGFQARKWGGAGAKTVGTKLQAATGLVSPHTRIESALEKIKEKHASEKGYVEAMGKKGAEETSLFPALLGRYTPTMRKSSAIENYEAIQSEKKRKDEYLDEQTMGAVTVGAKDEKDPIRKEAYRRILAERNLEGVKEILDENPEYKNYREKLEDSIDEIAKMKERGASETEIETFSDAKKKELEKDFNKIPDSIKRKDQQYNALASFKGGMKGAHKLNLAETVAKGRLEAANPADIEREMTQQLDRYTERFLLGNEKLNEIYPGIIEKIKRGAPLKGFDKFLAKRFREAMLDAGGGDLGEGATQFKKHMFRTATTNAMTDAIVGAQIEPTVKAKAKIEEPIKEAVAEAVQKPDIDVKGDPTKIGVLRNIVPEETYNISELNRNVNKIKDELVGLGTDRDLEKTLQQFLDEKPENVDLFKRFNVTLENSGQLKTSDVRSNINKAIDEIHPKLEKDYQISSKAKSFKDWVQGQTETYETDFAIALTKATEGKIKDLKTKDKVSLAMTDIDRFRHDHTKEQIGKILEDMPNLGKTAQDIYEKSVHAGEELDFDKFRDEIFDEYIKRKFPK